MAKTKKVYLLRNTNTGEIEYVGCTNNPKHRMYNHTKVSPEYDAGVGMFYQRTDLEMIVVKEFDDKMEALLYEGQLKKQYGFKWTEQLPKEFHIFSYKTKKLIKTYPSLYSAHKELQFNLGNMSQVIVGKRNHTDGIYGRYEKN